MTILADMRAALDAADRTKPLVWEIGAGARHALAADLAHEDRGDTTMGSTLLGYPVSHTDEFEGWALTECADHDAPAPLPTRRKRRT